MAQICEISPNFSEFWPSIPTNREMLAAVFRPLDQNPVGYTHGNVVQMPTKDNVRYDYTANFGPVLMWRL